MNNKSLAFNSLAVAYLAFSSDKPTGILKATLNPLASLGSGTAPARAELLRATKAAAELNLRYPGQYADEEPGQFYNYFRNYDPKGGRYTQADPIGLDGGWSRFFYMPMAMESMALILGV